MKNLYHRDLLSILVFHCIDIIYLNISKSICLITICNLCLCYEKAYLHFEIILHFHHLNLILILEILNLHNHFIIKNHLFVLHYSHYQIDRCFNFFFIFVGFFVLFFSAKFVLFFILLKINTH